MKHSSLQRCRVLLLLFSFALASARAGFIETFEDGTNIGDWRLTTSTDPIIEPNGGNPGAYLRQQVDTTTPTWGTSTRSNPFVGNYTKLGVEAISFDLQIFAGIGSPPRNATLILYSSLGSHDPLKSVTAYALGPDVSDLPKGWLTYSYKISALSGEIPPGWKVYLGDGHKGSNADWRALLQDVEFVGLELGTLGYIYPVWVWDLGLDNVRISKRYRPSDQP